MDKRLGEFLGLAITPVVQGFSDLSKKMQHPLLIGLFVTTCWTVVNEQLTLDFLTRFYRVRFAYFPDVKRHKRNDQRKTSCAQI